MYNRYSLEVLLCNALYEIPLILYNINPLPIKIQCNLKLMM